MRRGEARYGKSTILRGHGLVAEGWAHGANGSRMPFRGVPGHGKCECGALSDELPNTASRKRWHREHKEAVRKS